MIFHHLSGRNNYGAFILARKVVFYYYMTWNAGNKYVGTHSYTQRWFARNLVFQFLLEYIDASFQTQLPQYVRVK